MVTKMLDHCGLPCTTSLTVNDQSSDRHCQSAAVMVDSTRSNWDYLVLHGLPRELNIVNVEGALEQRELLNSYTIALEASAMLCGTRGTQ